MGEPGLAAIIFGLYGGTRALVGCVTFWIEDRREINLGSVWDVLGSAMEATG
jgi:hypothetical protein